MKKKKYFGTFLVKYLKGQSKSMIFLALILIGHIVLQIAAPKVLSHFIDSAKSGKTFGYISLIVLIYMVTIIFSMVGSALAKLLARLYEFDRVEFS